MSELSRELKKYQINYKNYTFKNTRNLWTQRGIDEPKYQRVRTCIDSVDTSQEKVSWQIQLTLLNSVNIRASNFCLIVDLGVQGKFYMSPTPE